MVTQKKKASGPKTTEDHTLAGFQFNPKTNSHQNIRLLYT